MRWNRRRERVEVDMSVMEEESGGGRNETWIRRLTPEQLKAIRLAAAIGDDIRKNCPEIAEEYWSGVTAPNRVAIMAEQVGKTKRCPYVEDPLSSCYCTETDSLSTVKVMDYCNKDYEQCEIYHERRGPPRSGGK
jgi:hypothetical protein